MKKRLLIIFSIFSLIFLAGCGNKQLIDTTYTFKYAEVKMPSGEVVKGKVDSWKDFEEGDTVQVVINGETYLTHISNVVLTTKENK